MSLRLTSDFYTSQIIRRVHAAQGFAYLRRRGAREAGTIYILHYHFNKVTLYGPAPQSFYFNRKDQSRLFFCLLENEPENYAYEILEKEIQFDPDIWIIDIENIDDISCFIPLA